MNESSLRERISPPLFLQPDELSGLAIHHSSHTSSHGLPPFSSLSLHTAINLLGLTWQLKPSDGPVLNNGLGAGLPVNSDVATLPSGGRGMNYSAHTPHTNPHAARRVKGDKRKASPTMNTPTVYPKLFSLCAVELCLLSLNAYRFL